ncbi:MAG: hypothetical protein BMS9Abin05_2124 [Rhodothermia bacterium]|nr:MAG: hypothetical protein BMS9Abin05_2124 [Rhodothermia bacterium]
MIVDSAFPGEPLERSTQPQKTCREWGEVKIAPVSLLEKVEYLGMDTHSQTLMKH